MKPHSFIVISSHKSCTATYTKLADYKVVKEFIIMIIDAIIFVQCSLLMKRAITKSISKRKRWGQIWNILWYFFNIAQNKIRKQTLRRHFVIKKWNNNLQTITMLNYATFLTFTFRLKCIAIATVAFYVNYLKCIINHPSSQKTDRHGIATVWSSTSSFFSFTSSTLDILVSGYSTSPFQQHSFQRKRTPCYFPWICFL